MAAKRGAPSGFFPGLVRQLFKAIGCSPHCRNLWVRLPTVFMKTDLEDDLAAAPTLVEALDASQENAGWDVAGSKGRRAMPPTDANEDEEGHATGAILVEAGVTAAEYDQMLAAEANAALVNGNSEGDTLENEDVENIDADSGEDSDNEYDDTEEDEDRDEDASERA